MSRRTSGPPLDDIAYLSRSEHRIPTLVALTTRPRSRSELWELAGVSSSTIRRTLSEFENRGWIQRDDYKYEATQLGSFVASAMVDVVDRIDTEHKLRNVWKWLPEEDSGFTIGMCTDAVVTIADANDPYRPVNRFTSLLDETDTLRFAGFDVPLLEPCKDVLCTRIVDGVEVDLINRPRVTEYIRTNCADMFVDALESGRLTMQLHDGLPSYGVGLLDDRIVITGYDQDGVTVRVLVDTETEAAREWAESTYRGYRRETPTVSMDPIRK